ncbi:MAG TPA: MIP/aquaporin family protein [Candidatus Limnocylindrales bacterium]|nr:MIP/aquaporin family protein [Candidatus Limnocylindrales bacterium]
MGTLILVSLGDGVVAGVLLKRSKAEGAGWMVTTSGWAFTVMAGVFVSILCGSNDAFLNPAVTLGFAVSSGDFAKLGPYIVAQLAGAFLGATLVWLHFLPHWKETPDQGLKLAVFCTAPAIRNFAGNLIIEIIGTFVLVFVVGAIYSKAVATPGPAAGLGPYLVACLVWGIGLSLGGTTGYAINPARDLGPRLAHAALPIAGKGSSDWGYASVPVMGPLMGAAWGLLLRAIG